MVEEVIIKTSPIEEQIAEVLAVDNTAKESVAEAVEKVWAKVDEDEITEASLVTADSKQTFEFNTETGEFKKLPIQTPLTQSELEEKALEAHYASLGQIEFYNKNIKK